MNFAEAGLGNFLKMLGRDQSISYNEQNEISLNIPNKEPRAASNSNVTNPNKQIGSSRCFL